MNLKAPPQIIIKPLNKFEVNEGDVFTHLNQQIVNLKVSRKHISQKLSLTKLRPGKCI